MVALALAKLESFIGFVCNYYFIVEWGTALSIVVGWNHRRRKGQTHADFSGAA